MEIVTNGEILGGEQLSPANRRPLFLKSRENRPPARLRPLPRSLPLTSPQPGSRSSQQPVSHMDQERKSKRKRFPYRPQSNFGFRQSRATSGVTSGPPRGVQGTKQFGRRPRGIGIWRKKRVSGWSSALPTHRSALQRVSVRLPGPGFPGGPGG